MYSFIKKLLFLLEPEQAHTVALTALKIAAYCGYQQTLPTQPITLMGLTFPNRIGLAAGLDKNAEYVDGLAALGFGCIEVGTVTPRAQTGNPRPRLFRLTAEHAIINRMGFNNDGCDAMVARLKKIKYRGILGINIGKNRDTPLASAFADYQYCLHALWPYASYFTLNISSPNTSGLRDLQQADTLRELLTQLKQEQTHILQHAKKYIPLVVKIAPDLTTAEVTEIAAVLLSTGMDGVIATNTTTTRPALVSANPLAQETGGLSGQPLGELSTTVIKTLAAVLQGKIPIIAVGGIMDAASAQEKFAAGADLLQVYSGFIFAGPGLVREVGLVKK